MSRPATSYPRRAEDHPWFETAGPIGLAHRGGALHPANAGRENTLAAFRMAAGMGLGYLETDVKLTADGHLVCFHDDTLDRCTDATGRVGARTLEQLREVRIVELRDNVFYASLVFAEGVEVSSRTSGISSSRMFMILPP